MTDAALPPARGEFAATSDAVEVSTSALAVVDDALIDRTVARAREAPQGRARVLLHPDAGDSLHEMVIALPAHSCDVPHINFKSGKSFHCLRGEFAVMVFAEDGSGVRPIRLSANGPTRMIRLIAPWWHTIIPIGGPTVFVETIAGPYTGNRFAPWSPRPEDGARWEAFSQSLRGIAVSDAPCCPATG